MCCCEKKDEARGCLFRVLFRACPHRHAPTSSTRAHSTAGDKHALTSVEDNKIGAIVRQANQLIDQGASHQAATGWGMHIEVCGAQASAIFYCCPAVSKPKEAAIDAAIFAEVGD